MTVRAVQWAERAKQSAYLRGGAVSLTGTLAAIVLSDHQLNSTNPPKLTLFNQSNSTKLQPPPFNINPPANHFIYFLSIFIITVYTATVMSCSRQPIFNVTLLVTSGLDISWKVGNM